jgi:chromosome segregation ATPase
MGSRNLASLAAIMLLALWCGVVHADIAQLKRDIAARQRQVDTAESELKNAQKAVRENRDAQKRAEGAALQALKKQAVDLADKERSAGDGLREQRQALGALQGQLRNEAAELAVKQVDAAGELDPRVDKARAAIKDWGDAIGDLPSAPNARDLSDVSEELREAFIKDDIRRLVAFEEWANDELKKVEKEIRSAEKLAAWNASAAKNGKALGKDARSLKSRLEGRKSTLEATLKSVAAEREKLQKRLK